MNAELVVKVCVLGPNKAGKTLLCQTLADQPASTSYQPTAGVRIQQLAREVAQDHVKVQLWDVAGDAQYQAAWHVLSKDVDGVLLVLDPQHPEQEKELEQFYLRFAQPHNLTMKQCCVLAVTHGEANTIGSWSGLQGKLRKLPSVHVHITSSTPEHGRKAAMDVLDQVLAGCIVHKKDKLENAVLGADPVPYNQG